MAGLQQPTLVLNRHWQPVGVTTAARALLKVWSDAAHILDPQHYQLYTWTEWVAREPVDHEPCIRTPQLRFGVPEVVTLTTYDRIPARQVAFSRRNVFKRDRFTCQYCGVRPDSEELTIDHVCPRAQGGVSSWENCVLACVACNAHKANRTPEQAGMRLRKVPVQPVWHPLYSAMHVRVETWARFVRDAYWMVELEP